MSHDNRGQQLTSTAPGGLKCIPLSSRLTFYDVSEPCAEVKHQVIITIIVIHFQASLATHGSHGFVLRNIFFLTRTYFHLISAHLT